MSSCYISPLSICLNTTILKVPSFKHSSLSFLRIYIPSISKGPRKTQSPFFKTFLKELNSEYINLIGEKLDRNPSEKIISVFRKSKAQI